MTSQLNTKLDQGTIMAITTLATEKDKTGAVIEIKHTTGLGYTQVLPFYMKQYASLCDKGWAHPAFSASNTSKAVYAEEHGTVIGHIVYNLLDDQLKTAWILLSAVNEGHRQRGIFKLMRKHFESTVKKAGSKKVISYVHIDNAAMVRANAGVGMKPFYYKMEQNI
jgi:hypothetical protein